MHIGEYKQGNRQNHEPKRKRKLLLHKREISKIAGKVQQKGYTLIPLSIYFKNGLAKLEIAIARGKSMFDKREDIKKKNGRKRDSPGNEKILTFISVAN